MKQQKRMFDVYFSGSRIGATMAVSEKQAINQVRFRTRGNESQYTHWEEWKATERIGQRGAGNG